MSNAKESVEIGCICDSIFKNSKKGVTFSYNSAHTISNWVLIIFLNEVIWLETGYAQTYIISIIFFVKQNNLFITLSKKVKLIL